MRHSSQPHPLSTLRHRVLYDAVDAVPFAYMRRGHDFYRLKDHVLWAHEEQGRLLSARSGACFAYRVGRIFYDSVTDRPLYYEG